MSLKSSVALPFAEKANLSPLGQRAYHLMLELVSIPSITGSTGEDDCAAFIYKRLQNLDYFRNNPNDLCLKKLNDDPLGRSYIWGLVRSSVSSSKTIILTGHIDVVDTDVYGPLRSFAFRPEEYTSRIGDITLPEEVRYDLNSGNYLFGRGVADMKTGVALNICILEEFASLSSRDCNILLLLVPDEEGDSFGMRGAVTALAEAQEKMNLDYLACINTEPVFDAAGPAIYYGTIGKMMPFYYCVGKESHVGEYSEGLNSTLLASYLNIALEGKAETCESYGSQTFPPLCCLHMGDLRARYAVTLPERCVVYYNCLTVSKTPATVLAEMQENAKNALKSVFDHLGRKGEAERVMSVEELIHRALLKSKGSLKELYSNLLPLVEGEDERDRNISFVSVLLDYLGEKGPLIIVGFLPPFYPPRRNTGQSSKDRLVREAAASVKIFLDERGASFEEIEIFQGITDLSYTGFQDAVEDVLPLSANVPLWGKGYSLPFDALKKLNIPCVLLGPIGKDAHKNTERVELSYSFNTLPLVLKKLIASLTAEDNQI